MHGGDARDLGEAGHCADGRQHGYAVVDTLHTIEHRHVKFGQGCQHRELSILDGGQLCLCGGGKSRGAKVEWVVCSGKHGRHRWFWQFEHERDGWVSD